MNDRYYIDAKASALDSKFEARLAAFDARIGRELNMALRWVIATTLGGVILNTSIMVAFMNRPAVVQPPACTCPAPARANDHLHVACVTTINT